MFDHNDDEQATARRFSRRIALLGAAQAAGFAALGWRYFELQVMEEGRYAPLAEDNRVALQPLLPKRGRILDAAGRVLADNEESFRATVTPALAGDVAATMSEVARVLPMTAEDVERIVKRGKKQSRNLPLVIASDIAFADVARLNVLAPELPGVRTEIVWKRRYTQGAAVGHVVGYVGSIDRVGIDDDSAMRLPDMRVGKTGAEAGFDEKLRGAGGAQKVEVDARGRIIRDLDTTAPIDGEDAALSIDVELQRRVLERLQRERRASCVALDARTGEVRVMASTPGYDPAEIVNGMTDETWRRLSTAEDTPLLNRALAGQYPPGSTFKMATALAALRAGVADAEESIECDGRFEYAGQTFRCWKRSGHGRMSLHQALKSSCDAYFFELARRVGIAALADAARQLGLGQTFEGGLSQHKAGLVPDPDWKRGRWNAGWLGGETILTGIGQGYLLATPLQLAVMTARIATGREVTPTLELAKPGAPAPTFAELPFTPAHLDAVRAAMVAVVNDGGGTGSAARLAGDGMVVAGKTGTSQVSRASTDVSSDDLGWGQRDHALFVAYVPAASPRYAVAAVVEHGGSGGSTAAPLVRDVMEALIATDTAGLPPADAGGRRG